MKLFQVGPSGAAAVVAAVTVLMAAPALAQEKPYDTPLYTPSVQPRVDPNFGLPTFGMPGADAPRQQATAPVTGAAGTGTASTQQELDLPRATNGGGGSFADTVLPSEKNRSLNEAPMYSSTYLPNSTIPGDRSSSSTSETPLYTTSDGTATEYTTPSSTTR